MILLVVIGHATFYANSTLFGGIDYYGMMQSAGVDDAAVHIAASWFSKWIYTFHMPLFISLSGAVYSLQKKKVYCSLRALVIAKTYRLVVPFFVAFMFWNLPIKWISNYYTVSFPESFMQIIFPDSLYLWYMEALFCCFVLEYIIEKKCSLKTQLIVNIILWGIGIAVSRLLGSYTPLGNPFRYIIWFWLAENIDGIITFLKRHSLWDTPKMVTLLFLQIVLFICSRLINRGLVLIDNSVLTLLMLPVCYYIGDMLAKRESLHNWVKKSNEYGLGIYLYAEPLNYLILHFAVEFFGIGVFGNEGFAFMILLLRTFGTVIVALFIVRIIKAMHVKYIA